MWKRSFRTGLTSLLALAVLLPAWLAVASVLFVIFPIVFVWFLAERLWRLLRYSLRKLQSTRFKYLALRKSGRVFEQKITLESAVASFIERPLASLASEQSIKSLFSTIRQLRKSRQIDRAVIVARLATSFADRFGQTTQRISCRRELAALLVSGEMSARLRQGCEELISRDRTVAPQLFAAGQIEQAKLLMAADSAEKSELAIHALESVMAAITAMDSLQEWADAKNLLSVVWWNKWRAGKQAADLECAIGHASECLRFLDEGDEPARWALNNYNLAIFYSVRASEASQADVERTISCAEAALKIYAPGDPNYVDMQMRLMAALSRRSTGDQPSNLDRAISCVNLALGDPNVTSKQKESLEKSLNTLLVRRWGRAVTSLATGKDGIPLKTDIPQTPKLVASRLREIANAREPFSKRERFLRLAYYIVFLSSVALCIVYWRRPALLIPSILTINLAFLFLTAAIAPDALEKWTMLPLEWFTLVSRLMWWSFRSKDSLKSPLIDSFFALTTNPQDGMNRLGQMLKKIDPDGNPLGWTIVACSHAWLSLNFPTGDRSEASANAIAIFQRAGDIVTKKRLGALQSFVDFGLAKAYLANDDGNRSDSLQGAISLLSNRVLPGVLIGAARKRGFGLGPALQLLGDAYSELAATNGVECWELALRCYVESTGRVLDRTGRRLSIASQLLSFARMRPGRVMLARSLSGIANALVALPDKQIPEQRQLAIACLANAYRILEEPGIIAILGRFIPALEGAVPGFLLRTRQHVETRFAVLVFLAQLYLSPNAKGERQDELAEPILRVCALEALQKGINESAYRALLLLGDILFRAERFDEAIDIYDMVIRYIETARNAARLIERRANIVRYNAEPFDRIIIAAVRTKRLADSFNYIERGKSLSTSDLVNLRDTSEGSNPLVEEYAGLQLKARSLGRALASSAAVDSEGGVLPGTTSIWNRRYSIKEREKFYEVTERLQAISESLRDTDKDFRLETKPMGNAAILQVARESRSALVFFRVTVSGTYVFVTTPNGRSFVSSRSLTRPALDNLLRELSPSLPRNWRFGPLSQVMDTLGSELMKPLYNALRKQRDQAGALPFDRVVLIPNRALSVLPLHACSWDEADGRKCMVEELPVVYAPSISIYKSCLARNRDKSLDKGFMGVFNPSGDLAFADWECEQLKALLPDSNSRFLLREASTCETVMSTSRHTSVVHFSCHGHYMTDAPMESYLALSNGELTLRQVLEDVRLDSAYLVVLSACESGLVDARDAADEYYGLPIAFVFAGAPTVWGTFWRVDDSATALMMVRAYQNLLEDRSDKAQALRNAQLWIRDATARELIELLDGTVDGHEHLAVSRTKITAVKQHLLNGDPLRKPYKAPYFWAAFHSVGA